MNSERTQISRQSVSAPTRWLVDNDLLAGKILHHGAGKAVHDTAAMFSLPGVLYVTPYDPNVLEFSNPCTLMCRYDAVVSNYVLNVLPPANRKQAINDILTALDEGGEAYITVRSDKDKSICGKPYEDGVVTSRNTFQKGFTETELVAELSAHFYEVKIVWKSGSSLMARCR